MNLIQWELIKIFKQKSIYIVGVFLLGWFTLIAVTNVYDTDATREVYREWEGTITEEKVKQAEKIQNDNRNDRTETDGFDERSNALADVAGNISYSQVIKNDIEVREADLNQLIDEAKSDGNTSLAKKLELQKNMYNEVAIDTIAYHTAPREAIDFVNVFGLIFTGLFLLLGLSGSYSNEHQSGVENYILSAKNGRVVTMKAKLIAGFIYTVIIVFAWEAFNLLTKTILYGTKGWDLPIQYAFKYTSSPYSLTFLEYHLIQLGLHLLGALAFAAVIVLISTLVKSTMISFFLSGFLFAVPILAESIFSLEIQWVHQVLRYTLTNLMKVEGLFMNFISVSVFQQPVLAPFVGLLIGILFVVIGVFGSRFVIKRKQIA